jgi:hypothetical protein
MAAAPDYEGILLSATGSGGRIADSWPFCEERGLDHDALVGSMKSLQADGYLVAALLAVEFWVLTEEAEGYVQRGSPEVQVFGAVPEGGADEGALVAQLGEALVKVGLGKCLKNKWLSRDKATARYTRVVRGLGCGWLLAGALLLSASPPIPPFPPPHSTLINRWQQWTGMS